MLYLDFNPPMERVIYNPSEVFDELFEESWFEDQALVEFTTGVNDAPITSPKNLAGCVKLVILAYRNAVPGAIYPLSWLAERVYPFLSKIPANVNVVFFPDMIPNTQNFGCVFIAKKAGHKITNYRTLRKEPLE
jgi:hypothetical protein